MPAVVSNNGKNNLSITLVAICLVSIINLSCASDNPVSSESQLRTAKQVLDQSGTIMKSVSSFEFQLSHKNISGTRIGDLVFSKATGLISDRNSMSIEAKFLFGNLTLSGGFSTINDTTFFLNPLTQKWEVTEDSVSPFSFFDPEKGIEKILSSTTSPKFRSNSEKFWNIEGSMPASSLSNLVGETSDNNVKIIVWIDKDSLYLTRAIISGQLNGYDDSATMNEIQRIINISRFNEEIVIENPLN
ncbi:MAG: hypothetical protein CL894_00770 [Dehalococcoidia bacterium]|nr:hypothetical protein [Dehalococcoidia bacterium]